MYIFIIIILVITIILLYYYNTSSIKIDVLIRQTIRWCIAARQDKSPMISLLHANYGAGYLWALRDIASESEINKIMDFNKLRDIVLKTQDIATKKVADECPGYYKYIDPELIKYSLSDQRSRVGHSLN